MELNLDFKDNLFRTICWILSIVSWLFFLLNGWIGFILYVAKENGILIPYKKIWSFIDLDGFQIYERTPYFPIQANGIFYMILFLILLIFGTVGFALYMFKTVFKKEDHVFDGMMGTFARYHFIPIICATILFIVGESKDLFIRPEVNGTRQDLVDKIHSDHTGFCINLSFSLIGLISLIFIKFKTEINEPFYIVYSIKYGFYSCLIPLFIYCLFYSSIYVGVYNKYKSIYDLIDSDPDSIPQKLEEMLADLPGFTSGCGIAFSIVIAVINIAISLFLKDILIPIINFIIYIGFAKYFFSIPNEEREIDKISSAEGALDIIMIILLAGNIGFLTFNKIKFRNAKEE